MINFRKEGKGKINLIFLHGWGGQWQSWYQIIEDLKSKYTIYALDLPGFGQSPLLKTYNLFDYVEDIKEFINNKKIQKPILIGHSFGGQITIKFASLYQELLSGLILVDSAGIRNNSVKIKTEIMLVSSAKRVILNSPFKNTLPNLRKLYYRLRGFKQSDYYQTEGNIFLQQTLSNITREDLTGDLEKISLPTLLFWGGNDSEDLTPLSHAKIMNEKIVNSKLVVISNAGHFSFMDNKENFCQSIKEFTEPL